MRQPRRGTARRDQVGGPAARPGRRATRLPRRAARPGTRSPTAGGVQRTVPGPGREFRRSAEEGRWTLDATGGRAEGGRRPRPQWVGGAVGLGSGRQWGKAGGRSLRGSDCLSDPLSLLTAACPQGPSRPVVAFGGVAPTWLWNIPPSQKLGTWVRGKVGGFLQPSPEGPWASAVEFLFQFSSNPPSGEAPMGRGERKTGRAPHFREPLPKPQRVPCWREERPSPPHHLSSRTGKRVRGRGGAWPDRGPGMGGHGRARGGPGLAYAERRLYFSPLLAPGEQTWRAGSRPSSCREMRCARCRCYTGSISPSRSGTT